MLASKYSEAEVGELLEQIRRGSFDGQEFFPSGGKKLNPSDAMQVRQEVELRNK